MAAFEVIALDTATPQLRAPGAADTYTFPRAVEMPLGTANGVLYLNGSKVVTSGSGLTFDGATLAVNNATGGVFAADSTGASVFRGLSFKASGSQFGYFLANSSTGELRSYIGPVTAWGGYNTWYIDNAEQMRLTSTGLGIGTNNPLTKLDVFANGGMIRLNGTGGNNLIQASTSSGATGIGLWAGGASRIYSTGSMVFSVNSTLTTGAPSPFSDAMTLDSSGNLGLGVTPSNSYTPGKVLQIVNGGVTLYGSSTTTSLGNNFNIDVSGNFLYQLTQTASRYQQDGGTHKWFTAPSGTAGNAISFTQAMTLDASGNLGIGTTSPSARLQLAAAGDTVLKISPSSAGTARLRLEGTGGGAAAINSSANGLFIATEDAAPMVFSTNNTERARIPATGGMVVGTAALATNATDGFLYVPTCAGTPTGTPTTQTGTAPIVINTTNNKLYFYSGGAWRDAGP